METSLTDDPALTVDLGRPVATSNLSPRPCPPRSALDPDDPASQLEDPVDLTMRMLRTLTSSLNIFSKHSLAENRLRGSTWSMGKICGTKFLACSTILSTQSESPNLTSTPAQGGSGGNRPSTSKARTPMDQMSIFGLCGMVGSNISGATYPGVPIIECVIF
jgi:hypothetical protein